MPTKTNQALLQLMREILEQNAIGLITDWEAVCAISLQAAQGQTPHEGDIDPTTGLKYLAEPDFDAEATSYYVNQDR